MSKPKERCANCGEETHFGNAVGERSKLKWCSACWRYRQKHCLDDGVHQTWKDGKGAYGTTPYDGRPPRD